jgi:serine protease Do
MPVPSLGSVTVAVSALAARLSEITVEVRSLARGGPAGAGVVWRGDGLILTNAHVADGPVSVVLPDRPALSARLVARDVREDLAALAVEANGLAAAEIGDSDALRVGELVLAVGNPLGVVRALSAGLVHAAGRRVVQADLRLAPGNSGGPLADARGRVVGLNAMIVGGLAVAVPSRAGARFVRRLGW